MDDEGRSWARHFASKTSDFNGYVTSLEDAEKIRKNYETEKSLTFVSGKKDANFGKNKLSFPINHRIRFNDVGEKSVIPNQDTPFIFVAKYERHCMFGKDKNKKQKERLKGERADELKGDHPRVKRKRQSLKAPKKKGCPAKIFMKEVFLFPDYKINQNTDATKRVCSEKLRSDIESGIIPQHEHRIYISLPEDADHKNTHLITQFTGFMRPLDKQVKDKLSELVGHGVSSVSEMKRHLRVFVDTEIFRGEQKPALSDAAFYPTDATIRKHIYLAQLILRYSKIDQENLLQLVSEWQESYPQDNFTFMPASSVHAPSEEDQISTMRKEPVH